MEDTLTTVLCATCTQTTPTAPAPDTPCAHCAQNPTLNGLYHLEKTLGQGASGTTFLARNTSDQSRVAIKEILLSQVKDIKALALFEREADTLKRIQHPGIPRYLDSFTLSHGRRIGLYTVMEYIEGENLDTYRQNNPLTLPEIIDIGAALAGILAYLHHLDPPIIHRDLKPSNIMRRPDGSLVLIDFGAVKDSVKGLGGTTMAGSVGFMPLEQYAGLATPQSDLYALGATLVALATHDDLPTLLDTQNRLDWHAKIPPDSPMATALHALLEKLLSPAPQDRPGSALEVQLQLQQLATLSDRRFSSASPKDSAAPHPHAPPPPAPSTAMSLVWPPIAPGMGGHKRLWLLILFFLGYYYLAMKHDLTTAAVFGMLSAISYGIYDSTSIFKRRPAELFPGVITDISKHYPREIYADRPNIYVIRYVYHDTLGTPYEGLESFTFYNRLDAHGRPIGEDLAFPLQVGQDVEVRVASDDPSIAQLEWDGRPHGFERVFELQTPTSA